MINEMKKAVIYTRVSTDEQAKNNLSLKGQKDAIQDYCKRLNIEIAEPFCDAGESAKTMDRPDLIRSLAYCSEHYKEIDYYIVWKLDRLARVALDTATINATLLKLGIKLQSATEPIDDTSIGRLTTTMLAGFAQFDNDVRSERSTSGVKRRIEEGGWPHMAPLGYKNIKDSQGRPTLEQSDQAFTIAKWLREYIKGGYTQKAMNTLAWDMGIRSKKGRRLPNQQTINMLRNPIYAGLVFSKMLDAPIKGLHEGIISFEEREAILDKLDNRKKSTNGVKASGDWPLRSSFLKCADCGESITGSAPKGRSKNYPIYHCPKCRAKAVGHKVSVPRDKLHEEFESLLESITPSEATLKLFRYQFARKWQNVHKEQVVQQQQLQQELRTLKERKQRVMTLFIDGDLSADDKIEQTGKIESEILRTELKLNGANDEVISSDVLIDFGINMISSVPKLWRICDELEQQRLQTVIFPEGLTYDFDKGFGTVKLSELYLLINKITTEVAILSNLVGAVGIEPTTKTLCSYYYFRNFFRICKLDYPFILIIGCLPSSLYTFPVEAGLGSGLSFRRLASEDFPEFDRLSSGNYSPDSPIRLFLPCHMTRFRMYFLSILL